jgi:hypothetical protein
VSLLPEEPPEDARILHEVRLLKSLIDQHAVHFYHEFNEPGAFVPTFVRQQIGKSIVNDIIMGNMIGIS